MGKFTGLSGENFGMLGMSCDGVQASYQPHEDVFEKTAVNSSDVVVNGLKTANTASQGKQKVPMMNIRFTPENYAYVRQESAMRGLSVTAFVNWIVTQYRDDPSHVHTSGVYQDESAW